MQLNTARVAKQKRKRKEGSRGKGKEEGRGSWARLKEMEEERGNQKRFLNWGNKHISIEFKFWRIQFQKNSNIKTMQSRMNARQTEQSYLI